MGVAQIDFARVLVCNMIRDSYHNSSNNQRISASLSHSRSRAIPWRFLALQLAALLIISIVFVLFDLDRKISGYLFRPHVGFYMRHQPLWVWLYEYGTLPGVALALAALMGWGASFWVERLKPYRRPCLLVVLTIVIAAGLLVNAVFKHYWGRPRPNQTIEFGGYWDYRNIFPPGTPGKGRSFPCGHCAMGFVFLSMWGFRRQCKPLAVGGAVTGIVLGGLLSATRVVQGGHFVSDTIWSLGLVTMTTTVLYDLIIRRSYKGRGSLSPIRKIGVLVVTVAAIVMICLGFLTRRPYFDTNRYRFDLTGAIRKIDIVTNADPVCLIIAYADQANGRVRVDTSGLGWINANTQVGYDIQRHNDTLQFNLNMRVENYFDELDHTLTLTLPRTAEGRIAVSLNSAAPIPR
jgi:lipid A 4'-phosphatase